MAKQSDFKPVKMTKGDLKVTARNAGDEVHYRFLGYKPEKAAKADTPKPSEPGKA